MDAYTANEMVLLATNLIIAPGLVFLGVWGFRDKKDFEHSQKEQRNALRRRQDRYPGVSDRRRKEVVTVLERRMETARRYNLARRQHDRMASATQDEGMHVAS